MYSSNIHLLYLTHSRYNNINTKSYDTNMDTVTEYEKFNILAQLN